MDLDALKELKQTLIRNTDPSLVSIRFFESFESDDGFMEEGVEFESDALVASVLNIGAEVFGCGWMDDFALCRNAHHRLVYGVLRMNRCTGTILFFEDVGIGLVTLHLNSREIRFVRFEHRPLPVGCDPDQN